MNILGINSFSHDTAACLLGDGTLVAFVEEERLNRDRHTKAFPNEAIAFCLETAGIGIEDVDIVAVGHKPGIDFARGAVDAVSRLAPKRLAAQAYVDSRLVRKDASFRRRWGYRRPIVHVGHHDAHAASAYFASPFDEAAVLTIDRGGDFLSTTIGHGRDGRMVRFAHVRNPHSLGEVYSAFTSYLGFHPNGDEGKVMGLAPYGGDRFVAEFREFVRLTPDGLFRVDLSWFAYPREGGWVSRRFVRRYGAPREPESEITERDRDLAYAAQALIEESALHVARELQQRSGSTRLCLAGGVGLNSVMNARLLQEAGFDDLFVQPASSDAGNALGAALWVWHEVLGHERGWRMEHAFWGPEWDDAACEKALAGLSYRPVDDPPAVAARLLAEGGIVGWFSGRAEIGPRALGARSILADPRRAEMKDVVNHRVKRRESFRPFAPSVLDERGDEYFEGYRTNPFMLLVLPVRPDKREVIPAVTHVDGTGRLQSVTREENPTFYKLIAVFDRLTGVPIVLNTSFNLRGEPIVNRPEEAVNDFLRSDMDALLLGRFLVEKADRPRATGGAAEPAG